LDFHHIGFRKIVLLSLYLIIFVVALLGNCLIIVTLALQFYCHGKIKSNLCRSCRNTRSDVDIGGTMDSESILRSAGFPLSRVRTPTPAP
ncbi:hypothetical protein PoB_003656500, partial [Plakobranchus ocellatus]